ncbi:MAG TPA: VWA domain-containing protein [Myxococcales bacterium]|nr:VWA domain-containing protein [Myxococcales bacterium]HIL00736.1 VWA domain-containing protein [Myxococcales bacterium]
MFLDLFYGLRDEGVPVAVQEWQMFMTSLEKGLHDSNLLAFYNVAKATLIKSETYYDAFDRVFARIFHGVEGELSVSDQLSEWMSDPKNFDGLTEEQRKMIEELDADELMRRYLETLEEQDERHDGGGRWVGTGGHSPFGNGGQHPTGIRVGGQSQNRSAMKVAEDRRFQEYRTDSTLDIRNVRLALKRLRHLTREGPDDELDLDETVDETCRNAGEIEFVYRSERRNNVRLLLLMDVGGTMEPYYEPVSRLLTALHEERGLRDFKPYYFHNCVYERLGTTADLYIKDAVPTGDILRRFNERWKVLIVGDAAMHPAELMNPRGNINPRFESETSGIDWLMRIREHFNRVVWLNPDPQSDWEHTRTTKVIQDIFPMYSLSIDGIQDAVTSLVGARPSAAGITRH